MDSKKIKRASGKRPKKRHFTGNKFTLVSPKTNNKALFSSPQSSASKKKLSMSQDVPQNNDINFQGNIIIDKQLIFSFLESKLSCKDCKGKIKLNDKQISGLSSIISISCENCENIGSVRNSRMIGIHKNIPTINRRFTYAMRCIGQGLEPMKTFCSVMDFYSPITQKTYNKINCHIKAAASDIAEVSMNRAAQEEVSITGTNDITISGDGSWKTRGHTSLIGVCTVIGAETGKVIDSEIMSLTCKACDFWINKQKDKKYQEWYQNHKEECRKNHIGSSGKMEVDGMLKIFHRSVNERQVRYVSYIGDGDAKTFVAIKESKPYNDCVINKIECVAHVQKRMGSRLRNLKQTMRGKKLSDGKTLAGKGRLTDVAINQLTNYYGNAIREKSHSLPEMRRAIWAIFYHKQSADEKPIHDFCPDGANSWCGYKKAVAEGKSFVHKNSLPSAVMDQIKPIFTSLSHPDLLKRCLGGKTQNSNESFNSKIWQYCPKTSGSGKIITEIATYEATIIFNEGCTGRIDVMRKLGLDVSINSKVAYYRIDKARVNTAEKRKLENTLEARRIKRMKKLLQSKKQKQLEGCVYEAGKF